MNKKVRSITKIIDIIDEPSRFGLFVFVGFGFSVVSVNENGIQ